MHHDTHQIIKKKISRISLKDCLLYTSDAADDMQCVDLGGRRIIKKHRGTERTRPRLAPPSGPPRTVGCFFKQKTAYEM